MLLSQSARSVSALLTRWRAFRRLIEPAFALVQFIVADAAPACAETVWIVPLHEASMVRPCAPETRLRHRRHAPSGGAGRRAQAARLRGSRQYRLRAEAGRRMAFGQGARHSRVSRSGESAHSADAVCDDLDASRARSAGLVRSRARRRGGVSQRPASRALSGRCGRALVSGGSARARGGVAARSVRRPDDARTAIRPTTAERQRQRPKLRAPARRCAACRPATPRRCRAWSARSRSSPRA